MSLTQIFDRPLRGREFFEEGIRDNLDLGRPDRVQLLFERRITKATPGQFRTRVIPDGVGPSLHLEYKQWDGKQYFKQGRGLRTESTFRNPNDCGVNQRLANLPYRQQLGRPIHRRLLEVERVRHHGGLAADSLQRVVPLTETEKGEKAPGLRFGQPRVMALRVALTMFQHLIDGFQNRDLRTHVATLPGVGRQGYSTTQMTYDLRRLLRKGLIFRPEGTNRYFLTPYGGKGSRLCARLEARVFRPARTAFGNQVTGWPPPLRAALRKVHAELDALIRQAVPVNQAA